MTIKVQETKWDLQYMYDTAWRSMSRRALFGYMLKTGHLNDPVLGGALALLDDIERAMETRKMYELDKVSVNADIIIQFAQVALAGGLNAFAVSEREIKRIAKQIKKCKINA